MKVQRIDDDADPCGVFSLEACSFPPICSSLSPFAAPWLACQGPAFLAGPPSRVATSAALAVCSQLGWPLAFTVSHSSPSPCARTTSIPITRAVQADEAPCPRLRTQDKSFAAVLLPSAERLQQIRQIAEKNRIGTLLIINPQWIESGQARPPFGHMPARDLFRALSRPTVALHRIFEAWARPGAVLDAAGTAL